MSGGGWRRSALFKGAVLLAVVAIILLRVSCSTPEEPPAPVPVEADWPDGYPPEFPPPPRDLARIEVGGHRVTVELADTADGRAYGLMFVSELPDDHGMLFLYPAPRRLGFWMRNTRIPLDIAYFNDDGRIRTLHERMEPFREDPSYDSRQPCRFALELAGGWFERHGVGVGDRIRLPYEVLVRHAEDRDHERNIPRLLPR